MPSCSALLRCTVPCHAALMAAYLMPIPHGCLRCTSVYAATCTAHPSPGLGVHPWGQPAVPPIPAVLLSLYFPGPLPRLLLLSEGGPCSTPLALVLLPLSRMMPPGGVCTLSIHRCCVGRPRYPEAPCPEEARLSGTAGDASPLPAPLPYRASPLPYRASPLPHRASPLP